MKKLFAQLILVLWYSFSYAQESIIPPSPTLSNLFKAIDYKPSHFTGVNTVEIPIFTINEGGLTVPIYLSYHSSGIKVSDTNGLVGLGWNLHVGGAVSRSIMGPADEVSDFVNPLKTAVSIDPNIDHSYLANLEAYGNSEFDVFSYISPTLSGRFILVDDGNGNLGALTIPYDPVKITPIINSGNISHFDIYDTKGVHYRFGKSILDGSLEKEAPSGIAVTGWHLTEMVSPKNTDNKISFKYSQFNENRHTPSHTLIVDTNYKGNNPSNYPNGFIKQSPSLIKSDGYIYSGRKIQEISFNSGKIEFDYNSGMLETVFVKDNNGKILKKIVLEKDFFRNHTYYVKLNKLKYYDDQNNLVSSYEFGYEEDVQIPFKTFGMDYWGYYNGENLNPNLVPEMIINNSGSQLSVGEAIRTPNEYYMKANVLTSIRYPTGGEAIFEYESNKYYLGGIKTSGGLRISKIRELDGTGGEIIKTYKYGLNESGYGQAPVYPDHDYFKYAQASLFQPNIWYDPTYNYRTWTCSSFPYIDLAPFGSSVVYREVTEYFGDQSHNIGKNVYTYDYNNQFINFFSTNSFSSISENKPYLTKLFDWKSGQLISTVTSKNIGGSYTPVKTLINSYETVKEQDIRGMHIYRYANLTHPNITYPGDEENFDTYFPGAITSVYNYADYFLNAGAKILNKTSVNMHVENQKIDTEYIYDNQDHLLPTRIKTTGSDGLLRTKHITYASDYSTGTAFLDDMKANHLIAFPIEEVSYVDEGENTRITSGKITKYLAGGKGLMDELLLLELEAPLESENFKFSNRLSIGSIPPNGTPAKFGVDSKYTRSIVYHDYDDSGNPLMVSKEDGTATSYFWGYNKQFPVVEIVNATNTEIAYTSFETTDKGGWAYTGTPVTTYKTGKKGYNLSSGSISKTGIAASAANPYRVGFWAKRTSGTGSVNVGGQTESLTTAWKWVEKNITSTSLTISGSSIIIDELRLHPADAMMTSYTYEPMVGMTSQTDPRGYTVSYFYDAANRLRTIKDEDGYILETYEYNYSTGGNN